MSNDPSAFKLPSPMEGYFFDRKMAAPMQSRCAFCGDVFTGSAREVLDEAAAHRKLAHPQAVDRTQKARREAARLRYET